MADHRVDAHLIPPGGGLPNNPRLPLLVYRGVLDLAGDAAGRCETLFAGHGWGGAWRNGIFGYDHFHATMHEVLGIVRGRARVRFGGDGGPEAEVAAGDVVVIPAGVGHRNLGASGDFLVIGAYPGGGYPDTSTDPGPDAAARVAQVPVPDQDPVYGPAGPLIERWTPA
ncbi:MAG: cupin domain-containing protein [Thalassobaculum sp.]|uniref:cupin n=1 Tax=Thalassobaculum sp. TaxID=2022740 RepID=UPI0032EDD698